MSQIPSQIQFLLDMLNWIDRGNNQKVIAKLSNRSKQSISYHIRRLKAKGLIEEIRNKPFSEYKLTNLGQRVKDNIAQSDGVLDGYFRIHALILGWKIENWGTWEFNTKLWKQMKGWLYQELRIKDHKIHIQSTGLMKIYCPEIYAKDTTEAITRIVNEANAIALQVADRYKMEITSQRTIREAHKELVGSNKIAELFGHLKLGGVWIDASTGKNELEEQNTNKLEQLLETPDRIERMEKVISEMLVPAIEEHSRDIKLHLAVLEEIRDALRRMGK